MPKTTIQKFVNYMQDTKPTESVIKDSKDIFNEIERKGWTSFLTQGVARTTLSTGIGIGIAYERFMAGASAGAVTAEKASAEPESSAEEKFKVLEAKILAKTTATPEEAYRDSKEIVALLRELGDEDGASGLELANEALYSWL